MNLPGESEAGSAGMQPCRGIARALLIGEQYLTANSFSEPFITLELPTRGRCPRHAAHMWALLVRRHEFFLLIPYIWRAFWRECRLRFESNVAFSDFCSFPKTCEPQNQRISKSRRMRCPAL